MDHGGVTATKMGRKVLWTMVESLLLRWGGRCYGPLGSHCY